MLWDGNSAVMLRKIQRIVLLCISFLTLIGAALLSGLVPASSGSAVDPALVLELSEQEEWDVSEVAGKVSLAESSRQQVIQDSIDASVSESESIRRSIEDSIAESIAESISIEESVAASIQESIDQSIAESVSIEESIAESIEASIAESVAASIAESVRESEEASIAASIAESEAASREEERRQEIARQEAEARRQAEEAARRAAEEAARRQAEEEARRQAEEAAKASGTEAPAAPPAQPAATGPTVLFGDSRTQGFIAYNLYPANLVFWTYNPVSAAPDLRAGAAALAPSKIVFLNGIDDICSYGAGGALGQYEAYIAAFQASSPGTRIFVHSVLAVGPEALGPHPQLAEIPAFNAMLVDMCARHGWTYIDCSQGYNAGCIGTDGIHYGPNWTAVWFNNILATVGF